ncbi:MAG: phosphate ABC transporter permease PstA [Firmicutes bacterium]|nr:phosphate ABC transporter permease PstA [Bacillota bacterium]
MELLALKNRRMAWSWLIISLCTLCTLILLITMLLILGYILLEGIPGFTSEFFTQMPVPVGLSGGGVAHAIAGSCLLIGLAVLFGVPWGLLVGIFLSEYGQHSLFGSLVRFTTDVLCGIPSITAGIFIYTLVVINMNTFSALAGGLALGIVMIPMVARNTESILHLVPQNMREAAMALGIPNYRIILSIVLPNAFRGIGVGVSLALAGIVGDPVPLFFTSLSNNYWSLSLSQPIASLPMEIYRYSTAPFIVWHNLALTGAVVLIGLALVPLLLVRFLLPGYRIRR